MIRASFVVIVAMSAVSAAQPAGGKPQTASAQTRLDAGTKAFKANDFATASKEFAAGYAAEPWSGFLFAWAQSERRRGDCPSAVKLYTRFTATNPPAEVRQLADDAIAACGATPVPVVDPPKPDPKPEPPVVVAPVEPKRDEPFPHKLAVGLGVGAVVAGGVGIAFYVASNSAADDANRAGSHPEAVDLYDRAKDRRLVAQICGGVSIALATAAVLRFVLHRESSDRMQVSVGPSTLTFSARW